jgi:hypothetical protein
MPVRQPREPLNRSSSEQMLGSLGVSQRPISEKKRGPRELGVLTMRSVKLRDGLETKVLGLRALHPSVHLAAVSTFRYYLADS